MRAGGAAGASLATALGLIFLIYDVGQGLTNLSYDLPYAIRPDIKPSEAVIIYMDEDSHSALKQPYDKRWNRTNHALLLQRLKACAVKAVAFDVLFDESHEEDGAFIQAIAEHGRVVVGGRLNAVSHGGSFYWETKRPIPEIQRVAAWGVAEGTDPDEMVRRHYAVATHSTNLVSLAWRTCQLTRAGPMPDLLAEKWLNYYGPPGTLPWVSYAQVLQNAVAPASLSNKVAFVGARIGTGFTGGKGAGTDDFRTPYSPWTGTRSPGVEINATAYLNLFRGEWLTRLSPWSEFLLVVGVGIVFGFGLGFFRPLRLAVVTVIFMLALFGAACALAWQKQVWIPWAIPALVQIPCAAVCAIVFSTQRLHKERQALEEKLAASASAGGPGHAATPSPAFATLLSPELSRQPRGAVLHAPSPGHPRHDAATVVARPPPALVPDCTLVRPIGAGAYGEVWLGRTVLGAHRAVKLVYRNHFREDRPYEREFEGIQNFDPISRGHPGLVHVLHVGRNDADGYFYYLMELADDSSGAQPFDPERYEAKTLGKELHLRGRLSVDECIQVALSLTDSLGYLHERGLIHRDVKPSNIIFVEGKPKLADIGLVTQIGEGGTFVGTEGFYPPEGPGSPTGDIYSLGKVLYEAITGLNREKFPELPTHLGLKGDLPRLMSLNKIILKACENNPRKRYASAREMHADLRRLTAEKTRLRDFFKQRPRPEAQNPPH